MMCCGVGALLEKLVKTKLRTFRIIRTLTTRYAMSEQAASCIELQDRLSC